MKRILFFLSIILVLTIRISAQTNPGFETGDLTGWTDADTGTESIGTSNARTGTYALSYSTNNSVSQRMENSATFSVPNNSYLHCIGWAVGSNADSRAGITIYNGTGWYGATISTIGTTLTRLTHDRINSSGATVTTFKIGLNSLKVTNSTILYWDDIVAYISTSATPDLTAPNAPSTVGTSSNSDGTSITITWTDGTDAATGSQKAFILRANGTAQTPPTLNDQAQYTAENVIGSWTVKGIVDVGIQTYSDNSTVANTEYTYAVYMSDLAYNYSTGTSSSVTALPVELTSFTSNVIGNKVELNWKTATEVNNYGFEVQRLAVSNQLLANSQELNTNGWTKIGFVEGNGNSNSTKSYSFTDEPTGGKEFNYRLKQIDFDGTYEYSDIVTAVLENISTFALEQNFPNPFNPTTMISYTIPERVNVKLKVYDMIAQQVAELVNGFQEAGHYQVTFDGSNLPSGVYFYKLEAGKFVEVKKFMLVR